MAATKIAVAGRPDEHAEDEGQDSGEQADFQRCGNMLGGAGLFMREVSHNGQYRGPDIALFRMQTVSMATTEFVGRSCSPAAAVRLHYCSPTGASRWIPRQKVEATVLGGCQDRRGKLWRIAGVFAATGALLLSGCASGTENEREPTGTDGGIGRESRGDREHRSGGHQVVREADRRRQHSVRAQRVQGSQAARSSASTST